MWRHVVLQWMNTVSSGSLTRQTYRYVTACAVCNCLCKAATACVKILSAIFMKKFKFTASTEMKTCH